jgi:hypothetical protein
MKRVEAKRWVAGLLAGFAVVATISVVFGVGSVQGQESSFESRLRSDGVDVLSATLDQNDRSAVVIVRSQSSGAPEDAWTRVAAERELIAANSANVSADISANKTAGEGGEILYAYTVIYVDQAGRVIKSITEVVQPRALPSLPKKPDSQTVSEAQVYVEQQTKEQGLAYQTVNVTNIGNQGPIVVLEFAVEPGARRDGQISGIIDMIDGLRDWAEKELSIPVQAYKVTIVEAGTERGLVGYVLQPGAESLHAWQAADVNVDFRVCGAPETVDGAIE